MRDKVNALEAEMKKQPQVDLQIKSYFAHNMYAREMFIPKGVMLTGKIHKYEHISIISKGDISILIDGELTRICAPFTFVAPSGTKRIALAHEDTIWTVMHSTLETDIAKIESHFIAQDEHEFLEFCGQIPLLLETMK